MSGHAFVLIRTPTASAELTSALIWEQPGVLGIEELPADGQPLFRPDLDHHFVRFDGRQQYENWLRTEEFRRGEHVLLKVYHAGVFPDAFDIVARGTVDPEDYLAKMREQHHGRIIGDFWVGPPWERPVAGKLPVIIEPGTAFGLGDHPTTQLCLELLADIPQPRRVLDFGAGSGILAIAAAKLFPGCDLTLIELDRQCWPNIEHNFELNALPVPRLYEQAPAGSFDLVLANVYLEVLKFLVATPLRRRARSTRRQSAAATNLIVSGLLGVEQFTEFKRHLANWQILRQLQREDWFALELERC